MAVDLVNDKPSNNRSWCVGNAPYALPHRSVIYDNNSIGLVSVSNVLPEVIKNAPIIKGAFPK
jgi:hypothetical protein